MKEKLDIMLPRCNVLGDELAENQEKDCPWCVRVYFDSLGNRTVTVIEPGDEAIKLIKGDGE